MAYFLDTPTCLAYLCDRSVLLNKQLEQTPMNQIKIPAVVVGELLYLAKKSEKKEVNKKIIMAFISLYDNVPYGNNATGIYAAIRFDLEQKKHSLPDNELIKAAVAMANNACLVTTHVKAFSYIEKLNVVDWSV